MKKVLLFLFALLTTATVWAQDFTPLQMGDNGPFTITNDGVYLSFTPEETDYYVFVGTSDVKLDFAINMDSPDYADALSELDEATNTYVGHLAYTQKLEAGLTYKMLLRAYLEGESGDANVVVSKGYLVSTDAASAGLLNMLRPLPYVAFEGENVKLTANEGVTINSLTATANGEPVEITESGSVYSFTMPAADVTISGSGEMQTLQLGDNEVNVVDFITYAFTPTESGAYIFTMDCDVDAMVQISSGNDMIAMGYAPPLETLSSGVMLDANVTYGVVAFANVSGSNIVAPILNISKYELAPITVGDNEIYAPNGNEFYYPFIPEESGEYTFSTSGFAALNPAAAVMLGNDVIDYCVPNQTDINITVTLQAGVAYAFRVRVGTSHGAFMHLNVTNDGGSPVGDDNVLQMGDNEVVLAEEPTLYTFTPAESGAYLFTMNCDASAMVAIADNDKGIASSLGYAEVPGQTICAGIMLEAGVTCQVATRLFEGSVDSAILNIAKYEIAPITLGENEIYAPYGSLFEYPFTPPVSGEYTFRTIGDASLSPSVGVFLGEDDLGYDEANNEDAEFTATLEAGVTYTVRTLVGCYNASLIHLTVVSPLLAINVPESFEHGMVTSDKEAASIGETVTLTVTPDNGYEIETLTVTFSPEVEPSGAQIRLRGGSVDIIPGTDLNTFTFEMPAAPVYVNATFKEATVTGVQDLNAAQPRSGQRYNLMGQPVGDDYKGIVIQDGKKFVVK